MLHVGVWCLYKLHFITLAFDSDICQMRVLLKHYDLGDIRTDPYLKKIKLYCLNKYFIKYKYIYYIIEKKNIIKIIYQYFNKYLMQICKKSTYKLLQTCDKCSPT